jgi:hypothetical protein
MEVLIIFVTLFVIGGIWVFFRYRQVKAFNLQRRRAKKATARLIRVDHSINSERYGEILANIVLEIRPPDGEPYALKNIEWYIEPAAASKFQAGLVMNVRIDADNPNIIFPAERWARIA